MIGIRRLDAKESRSICKKMDSSPSIRMAYGLLFEGDIHSARERFERVLDENKDDPDALAGMAICVVEDSGRFVSATKLAMLSVKLAPKSPAGYYALAYIHLLGSKLEPAYRYLMKAEDLAPADPRVTLGKQQLEGQRPPVISDLPREHFLNKALGKSRRLLGGGFKKMVTTGS